MKLRSRQVVLAALLAAAALCAAVIGVLAVSQPARAQASVAGDGPQTGPPACACARQTSLADDGQITNCQCGALQCVVAIGARTGSSQLPALACIR